MQTSPRIQHHGLDVTHEYNDDGQHRILYGMITTQWFDYKSIARVQAGKNYIYATTPYFAGDIPELFVGRPLKNHEGY